MLLTLRFGLELALLAAFGVAGWRLGDDAVAQGVLAAALPLTCAAIWGALIAPKARWDAPLPLRIGIEVALFGAASGLLWLADVPAFALLLLAGELLVLGALLATGQRPGRDQRAAVE